MRFVGVMPSSRVERARPPLAARRVGEQPLRATHIKKGIARLAQPRTGIMRPDFETGERGWHMDRTFVAIDVETTELEAGTDEIIEVAAVKFTGDTVLETFQKLVKPHHSLPLKIARLTNISDEMLVDAPRFSEVAPELVRFVKSYPLVGHSVGFDLKMLQAQGMRFPQAAYDTFDMATL